MTRVPQAQREPVLIILDEKHARRVGESAVMYSERCARGRLSPTERRVTEAIVTALKVIFERPEGWYDAEFRVALTKMILPRLSRKELNEVMEFVYEVVPRR